MLTSLRKHVVMTLTALALIVFPATIPVAVVAAAGTTNPVSQGIQDNVACGTNLDTSGTVGTCGTSTTSGSTTTINTIIHDVVNIFSAIVGIVSVIMIIFGGFKYITSGGDSGNITGAKNTIIYAVIGLVVVALSQFIVQFVLNKVTNP